MYQRCSTQAEASRYRAQHGGWVIRLGDSWIFTDDEGHAVEAVMAACADHDRESARRAVRSPQAARERAAPCLTPTTTKRLSRVDFVLYDTSGAGTSVLPYRGPYSRDGYRTEEVALATLRRVNDANAAQGNRNGPSLSVRVRWWEAHRTEPCLCEVDQLGATPGNSASD